MFRLSRQVAALALRQCRGREIATSAALRDARSLQILKKKQCNFQREDGKPIFLKGGILDRILYVTTLILCLIGLGNTLLTIYHHAKPASWRTDDSC